MSEHKRGGFLRTLAMAALVPVALVTMLSIAVLVGAWYFGEPVAMLPSPRLFRVNEGESLSAVADRLESEGLIRSSLYLRLYARFKGLDASIQKGVYEIDPSSDASSILGTLASGKQHLVRITIPEGLTSRKIAERFEAAGITKAADFLEACRSRTLLERFGIPAESAEGYLFPETYLFPLEYDAEKTVATMIEATISLVEASGFASLSKEELHERIVLASIVEREYRREEEAAKIAGVFVNRLRSKMRLQSCATVVFVLTEHLGREHPRRLFNDDLLVDDPYNTYLNAGLPPGPIANPGKTAIRAALSPEKHGYLFFVLVDESTGTHFFSSTYDAHLSAKTLSTKGW